MRLAIITAASWCLVGLCAAFAVRMWPHPLAVVVVVLGVASLGLAALASDMFVDQQP